MEERAQIVSLPLRHGFPLQGIALVLFGIVGLSATARAQDVVQGARKRVVVFDIQSPAATGSAIAQLPDLIEQLVSKHLGYEVIPDGDMHRALAKHSGNATPCATSAACRREVARELHADLLVSGSLDKTAERWVLSLALNGVDETATPKRTSESMKQLKSVPRNVELCLERLFDWSGKPKPPETTATSGSAPAPLLLAPPAEPADQTLLAHAPSRTPKDNRPVLALLTVNAGAGFAGQDVVSVESLLLSALEATGRFHVIGHSDIVTLLDLEAKKEAVGCNGEDTSCMTAIAGALGADYVAAADLATLGHTMLLSFKVIEVRSASALVHANETVQTKDDLVHATQDVAAQTVTAIFGRGAAEATAPVSARKPDVPRSLPSVDLSPPPSKPAEAPSAPAAVLTPTRRAGSSTGHTLGIVGTILGGVALVVGTGLGIAAQQQTTALRTVASSSPAQSRVNAVNGLVGGAIGGWVVGGAVAATGVGLLVAF